MTTSKYQAAQCKYPQWHSAKGSKITDRGHEEGQCHVAAQDRRPHIGGATAGRNPREKESQLHLHGVGKDYTADAVAQQRHYNELRDKANNWSLETEIKQ